MADGIALAESFAGGRQWRQVWGGGNDDVLAGVVAIGSRLFAVGHTRSVGAGGADAVVFEIDPADGARLQEQRWGGANDDMLNAAATDGKDLYAGREPQLRRRRRQRGWGERSRRAAPGGSGQRQRPGPMPAPTSS
jgi:hypothetical protein